MVHFFFDIKCHLGELPRGPVGRGQGVLGSLNTFLHVHGNLCPKEAAPTAIPTLASLALCIAVQEHLASVYPLPGSGIVGKGSQEAHF